MDQNKQISDQLVHYRRRMGFSQKYVSHVLGRQSASLLSAYEHGRCMPSLKTAMDLASLYRVPVEELFLPLYLEQRNQIRDREERLKGRGQQNLFRKTGLWEDVRF